MNLHKLEMSLHPFFGGFYMEPKELIFNKVNGSFVDGYGIRTTIFLKGCPLHCKWCCNPEGQSFQQQLRYLADDCNGCGACVPTCPKGALEIEDGKAVLDRGKCNLCGKCIEACWPGALRYAAQLQSVDEVFSSIIREKPFFDHSGGGLTIGGGEASSFPDFCLALIAKCHGNGIRVAIDTCGYTLSEESLKALDAADLLLYDIKGIDEKQHIENTGVSNKRILDNFHHFTEIGKPMIVRLPVIPGCNDQPEDQEKVIQLLKNAPNVERVDIIPFHTFGSVKYGELGMPYPMPEDAKPLTEKDVADYAQRLRDAGLNVQIGG